MRIINFGGNRSSLNKKQRDFLVKIIPAAQLIQLWVMDKADFVNIKTSVGILPSLVLAELIIQSNWGSHPISQEEYCNKYSNNLALLEADKYWLGKKQVYEDKSYRAYKDWSSFCVDFSDYIIFSDLFISMLDKNLLSGQIIEFSKIKPEPRAYQAKVEAIIEFYGLEEFDY